MSYRQQLERIFEIDRQIRAGLYPNAEKIAREMEVSKRVIYKDREFMINRLGAPIEYDRERGGWFYTDETWTLPNIMVTEGELLALFLSIEVARRYLGTKHGEALRSAIEKIARTIKGAVAVELEQLKDQYTFAGPALVYSNEETLLGLHEAIRKRRWVWMRYYTASRDEHTERRVAPYHLYNANGLWYLVAFDELRGDFRSFAVGRIEAWRELEEGFEVDRSFSIARYMSTAFQVERGTEAAEVAVRFDREQARYIRERLWHASQEVEELADGGLILRFRSGGLGEVQRWVMQYGSHAEVLSPPELRERVRMEAERMREKYEKTRISYM